jgi:peptidoglycan/LPS O-acetylase OafA/YrhL
MLQESMARPPYQQHSGGAERLPVISLLKASAAQIVLWHHFALYGPMSDAVNPHVGALADWLIDYGNLAVQPFLVIGGFLAARLVLDTPGGRRSPVRGILQRYRRLAPPYVTAVMLAVAAAAFARALIEHPTIPAEPTFFQLVAHLLLVHDLTGQEALSAGVWYVAIDFQLYALLCLIGLAPGRLAPVLCAGLAALSLFWLNRLTVLDVWAIYFFGAYGMGIFAAWISRRPERRSWLAVMAIAGAAALFVDWREQILVATATALLLAAGGGRLDRRPAGWTLVDRLAEISYPLFLLHYPVLLIVGSLVHEFWPGVPVANALGLLAAWCAALLAARWQHRWLEATPRGLSPGSR